MMRAVKGSRRWALLVAASCWAAASAGTPPLVQEVYWRVTVDVLLAGPGLPGSVGVRTLDLASGPPTELTVPVPWPGLPGGGSLRLEGSLAADDGDAADVSLWATLDLGRGSPVRASRRVRLGEASSVLFEVYSENDARIIVAMQGERGVRTRARAPVAIGSPIRIVLSVERVDGDRYVPLERNELHTFLREPVTYSFRRGGGDALEAIRLDLTPLRTTGDLVEIRVSIAGTLPGTDGLRTIEREETHVVSRGSTSSITLTSGSPVEGYRFGLTPDF